jgi:hypothetical protein
MATMFKVIAHVSSKDLSTVLEVLDGCSQLQSVQKLDPVNGVPEQKGRVRGKARQPVRSPIPRIARLVATGKAAPPMAGDRALVWATFRNMSNDGQKAVQRGQVEDAAAKTGKVTQQQASAALSHMIHNLGLIKAQE